MAANIMLKQMMAIEMSSKRSAVNGWYAAFDSQSLKYVSNATNCVKRKRVIAAVKTYGYLLQVDRKVVSVSTN